MAFKLLRYTVMVLTDYEREEEKKRPGITRTKEFRYPPILPIVYYEGTNRWTAARNFKERVYLNEILGQYIPDFEYLVVPVASYTNEELIEKKDELSLIMLINKLRKSEDFKSLQGIPAEYFQSRGEISKKPGGKTAPTGATQARSINPFSTTNPADRKIYRTICKIHRTNGEKQCKICADFD